MASGIAEYSRRSADLLDAAERLDGNPGNDLVQREAIEDLLRATDKYATDKIRYGFSPQPGAPPPPTTDGLAGALFELQAGNVLVAAGLNQREVKSEADPDLLLDAQRQIDGTRQDLVQPPRTTGFYAKLTQASATIDSACGNFRNYSDQLLKEIVKEASTNVSLAGKKLGTLDAGALGDLLGRIGEAIPFVSDAGRLIKRGVAMIRNAIESLISLFGKDALQKIKDAIGDLWDKAGDIQDAVLGRLLGTGKVSQRITEILASPGLHIKAVDTATNDLAPLGTAFTADIKLLRGIITGIGFAGAALGFLHVTGPWLTLGLGLAYATAIGATLLVGREYTGEGPLSARQIGVVQLADRILAG